MKIFTGEVPENPCVGCDKSEFCAMLPPHEISCMNTAAYYGQQSILSQCIDIPEDKTCIIHKGKTYEVPPDELIVNHEEPISDPVDWIKSMPELKPEPQPYSKH
jgi:hypothetical protein